jgi:curved DNA-binding protein
MDHYQTLGVAKNATPDEIKKAYRKLASQHHPDRGGDTAMFQKIQVAYDTLSDPNKKQQYDNPQPEFHGFSGDPGFRFNGHAFDMGGIFEQIFRQQQQHVNRNPVYRTTMFVTLEQVYNGEEQILKLQTPKGSEMVKVQVPKGIENGGQVRYDGVLNGASLLVEFRTHAHLKFERRGVDLYCNQPISVLDLIVGTKFEFTTISGKTFEVKVAPKTQPHMQLKVSGQGMPVPNSPYYGDQIILLKPFIPDIIDEDITNSILRSVKK